ncbi:tRNA (adenosine(37)-N6)-threonylcarbamoyltransferase complex ATPase subunit type 1 TsaE [Mucisphaera calidilacus]|uniref:tRNA threonylcarbamoyladenosine biosynthesis protein TsaE n=1 Tax=Mucisphaera calidilacus TaxID=2527982 RepID=A0A518BVF3_9BACT|nr:tRNA (adenosine(37)-N6)-threonylcarbamoyltransferase complex ATPase subunit type 1 TsaE [Mucisphaera calidilacus]QDU70962.1 tRNA threonylcarbamoyladenosine biosynthesis protein TsaE [Mucisphaera calidilacus]
MSELRSLSLELADEEATLELGRRLGRLAPPGLLLALTGELGAGKTTLVRGLAEGLGLDAGVVSSPTFVFVQEYPVEGHPGVEALVHIDAYRLDGPAGLPGIGWEGDGEELRLNAVTVVEWADRVADGLPPERVTVSLRHRDEGREAVIEDPTGLIERQRLGYEHG